MAIASAIVAIVANPSATTISIIKWLTYATMAITSAINYYKSYNKLAITSVNTTKNTTIYRQ